MIINRSDSIGVFQFEGNVNTADSGGTNGTVTGTTQYADSISGRGFDFDGSTRIEVGESGLSNSSNLSFLITVNNDTLTDNDRLFSKTTNANNSAFYLFVANSGTEFRFTVRNAADTAFVTSSISADTNVRCIMCYIDFDNDLIGIKSYQSDGTFEQDSTAFTDANYTTTADNITIGGFTGGGREIDGIVDNVVICTSVLSDEDFYRYYMGMGVTDL